MQSSRKRTPLTSRQVDAFKPWLILLCLLPFLRWLYLGWADELTANPMEFLTRSSGTWALVGLLLTLSVTPLQVFTKQAALIRVRRLFGLASFSYALLHMLAWAWWDQGFDVLLMWKDFLTRPFVTVGLVTFALLTALAVTSNQWTMRTLKRRWKTLHRLIYVATLGALVHYWLHKTGKNDYEQVIIYSVIVSALLGWRLLRFFQNRARMNA